MKKNKEFLLNKIEEKTGRSKEECTKIGEVLDSHFVIGHNNKDKIKKDFVEKLNITLEEADNLYNTCAEIIVTSTITRK